MCCSGRWWVFLYDSFAVAGCLCVYLQLPHFASSARACWATGLAIT
jgi:hypothetical protein